MRNSFWADSLRLYRDTLLSNVVPFWLKHGLDRQYGGLSNVMDDGGAIISHDKYLWSQGRALWTFSALYNRIERKAEWLDAARHVFQYLAAHGRDDQGRWMYRLDQNGRVLDKDISIYVDGFVLNGLGEYWAACRAPRAQALALETFRSIQQRLAMPGSYGVAPYEIPVGLKTHGVAMIFSLFYYNLGEILSQASIQRAGLALAHEVLDHFYVPAKNAILEFVTLNGKFTDTPTGRACVPGHALESLWFLISIFERTKEPDRIKTCCRLIQRHLELGWDPEYGGLRLALDIDGQEPVFWKNPECKPWWVQVEALVATAYAYLHSHDESFIEWHQKVRDYAFTHYPVPAGEWTQWLDRFGKKTGSAALPVKDPFHLPRGLMYLIELCERIIRS